MRKFRQVSGWFYNAYRHTHTRSTLVSFNDQTHEVLFTITKAPGLVRGKQREGAWSWTATTVMAGTRVVVSGLASYDKLPEAKSSAEWAARRGFHQIEGTWMPKGATKDFPDGVVEWNR